MNDKVLFAQKIIRFIPYINAFTILPLPFVIGKYLSFKDIVKITIGGMIIVTALFFAESLIIGMITDNNVIIIIKRISGILTCYCISFYSVYIQERIMGVRRK